jgi:lipopolysaccharide transport system ATP-binding protein
MGESAIRVEGLSKRYRIGRREKYRTLRDTVMDALNGALHVFSGNRRAPVNGERDTIWALKDVSFEINRGDVVGVIGRNGAGKTTLLKILSRITEPTAGYAEVYGRVGSLLEVGTGFHPELTGRENIYLNGTILGMKKREIDRRFDEIVDFAEVEKFLDTPVKHYSSGMHMRLAFAIAAHLEPEILLVDEVLAVGDAAFQKKCLGKIGEVRAGGHTVLFVSHNLQAVRSLCNRCLLLRSGRLAVSGDVEAAVVNYLNEVEAHSSPELDLTDRPRPNDNAALGIALQFTKVKLNPRAGKVVIETGEPLEIEIEFACRERLRNVVFGVGIIAMDGTRIVQYRSSDTIGFVESLKPGCYVLCCRIENVFAAGLYTLELGARAETKGLDWLPDSLWLRIIDSLPYESFWLEARSGYLKAKADWKFFGNQGTV